MFKWSTVTTFLATLVVWGLCTPVAAQQYHVQQMRNGTYQVYDPVTQKTDYVRDPKAWAAQKEFERTGFGSGISPVEFSQGHNPLRNTVKIAARTVDGVANTAVNTAVDAAAYVPGWRRYSNGVRQVLHGGTAQGRR